MEQYMNSEVQFGLMALVEGAWVVRADSCVEAVVESIPCCCAAPVPKSGWLANLARCDRSAELTDPRHQVASAVIRKKSAEVTACSR